MTILEKAIKYVTVNKWSVIPVKNKVPQLSSWQEYQQRLPTELELQKWFTTPQSELGIGIVTGKMSGISVVDVDGMTDLKLMSPVTVKTPRGKHYYFKYEEGVKNHVRLFENVDIRSEGGFVCAPPTPGYYFSNPFFNLRSLPKFPVDLLPKKEETRRNEKGWLAESLNNLKEGNRDDTFTKIIGRLHYDGHTSDSIYLLLAPYATTSGFGLDSLRDKIEHIVSAYPKQPKLTPISNGISLSVDSFLEETKPVEWIVEPFVAKQSLNFFVGLGESLKTWATMDMAIEVARGGKWLNSIQTKQARVLFIDQERPKFETQRRFKALLAEKGLTKEELADSLYIDVSSHRKMDIEPSFQAFKNEIQQLRPSLIIVDSFVTFHTKDEKSRMEIQKVLDKLKELREEFGCSFLFINHPSKLEYQDIKENLNPTTGSMSGSVGINSAAEGMVHIRSINKTTSALYHTKNTLGNKSEDFMFSIQDTDKGIKLEAHLE